MPEKYENIAHAQARLTKTEQTLIKLYRKLSRHDRWYLRRVLVVMVKASLRRT
jgi:hypothetical protein